MLLQKTKSPLLSFIAVMPLVLIYEITMFLRFQSETEGIRNGADILLKKMLAQLGFYGFEAGIVLFLIVFIMVKLLHNIHFHEDDLNYYAIPLMIAEGLLYALLIFYVLIHMEIRFIPVQPHDHALNIGYSCGAGVYEELIFRAILMYGFFQIFGYAGLNKTPAWILAIILSTTLFVGMHYIGDYKYQFEWFTFLVRTLVSVILSLIFLFRGFAVAAYTHTFYNLSLIYLGGVLL